MTTTIELIVCCVIALVGIVLTILGCPAIIMFIVGIVAGYLYPDVVSLVNKIHTKCSKK